MPKVSKETASQVQEIGPVTDRREDMGGYTVNFASFAGDADLDGPLQALPGGACQCPHWGYVIAGRMRFVFGDHEEVYEEVTGEMQDALSELQEQRTMPVVG